MSARLLLVTALLASVSLFTACAEAESDGATEPAQDAADSHGAADTEAEIEGVVDAFHAALAAADSSAVAGFLDNRVRILEGGVIETKQEYLSHHFHADARYLSSVDRTIEQRDVNFQGSVAWVTTRSRLMRDGEDGARSSLELLVLRRGVSNWMISSIHWSSARARD